MKSELKSFFITYKWIFITGIIIQIITCILSVGYHNPDEHWQINEFAAFKLGLVNNENDLPWEHRSEARQTVQPFMVFVVSKIAMKMGIFQPFYIATFFRFLSGFLAWTSVFLLLFFSKSFFKNEKAYKWAIITSNLLWFIPYVHARFQGENWTGIFLTFGVALIFYLQKSNKNGYIYSLVGLLFGFAFILRFQVAFAIIAVGIWQLIFKKMSFSESIYMFLGFLAMVGIEVVIDYWYFGKWIFVPYNYFHIQLIEGISNNWGVFPWWHYATLFIIHVSPPISIFMLIVFLIITYYEYKNQYIWIIWLFILGHNMNGYKEIRYLYPLIPFFIVLVFMFYDKFIDIFETQSKKLYFKILFTLMIIQNLLLITVCALKPAHEGVNFFSKIYSYSNKKINLYYIKDNPYFWGTIKFDFYEPQNISYFPIEIDQINLIKPTKNENTLLFYKGFELEDEKKLENISSIYKTIPAWLKNFNINNWLSRAKVWSLYEIK